MALFSRLLHHWGTVVDWTRTPVMQHMISTHSRRPQARTPDLSDIEVTSYRKGDENVRACIVARVNATNYSFGKPAFSSGSTAVWLGHFSRNNFFINTGVKPFMNLRSPLAAPPKLRV
eukprot:6603516-Pyramimonas_sp.AAC.2